MSTKTKPKLRTITFDPSTHVLVPIKPTETMIVEGFESRPDKVFSPLDEWDKYSTMSGCEQAAYCAEKCWNAMLKAAPPQSSGSNNSSNSIPNCSNNSNGCREALGWNAAALQNLVNHIRCRESDVIRIEGKPKTLGEILDMANAALEAKS